MATGKYLIAGNWKMNKVASEAVQLSKEICKEAGSQTSVSVVICTPFMEPVPEAKIAMRFTYSSAGLGP